MPPAPAADAVMALLCQARDGASDALDAHLRAATDPASRRARGDREGQYRLDLGADQAVVSVLAEAGFDVLSEESGFTVGAGRPDVAGGSEGDGPVVVVDPVDGSTNASRGIPWYACSLCAVDAEGPWVALVTNLATGVSHSAVRGAGAHRTEPGGAPVRIGTSGTDTLAEALVLLNGHPDRHFGWRQYRSLGATALDICAVADGSADASIDCTRDALGPWDYMAAMLVLTEAGGAVQDVWGRDLAVLDHGARRTPVGAASAALLDSALSARGTD